MAGHVRELRSAFEPYGEIARVQVMTDRDTGRARGFAGARFIKADGDAVGGGVRGDPRHAGNPQQLLFDPEMVECSE